MLEIYYDFSGYSDMAIGIGKMLGYDLHKNFHYPYLSQSITEFWRRWHISLGAWFRNYLYIPLGGNRKGTGRTYLNLFLVFLATGLWHGAGWNFIVWGIWNGIFMVLERLFLLEKLKKNSLPFFNHLYTCVVLLIGWILFRSETLSFALDYLNRMIIPTQGIIVLGEVLKRKESVVLLVGLVFVGPIQHLLEKWIAQKKNTTIQSGVLLVLYLVCVIAMIANSSAAFIYAQF